MATYTTKSGDTWDSIAYRQMGKEIYVPKLMMHNRKYIDLYFFPSGVVLDIPDPDPEVNKALPPWKRGAAS